jgi:Ca2+-binding EF-hand superfamily protein
MGNSHLKLHGEAKLAATKFDKDEIEVLEKTWRDMAERNNGKGVDKETFLQYFPLNGLLGERLFAQFNKSSTDLINFDDFITGLAIVCRGNKDEKIHFLFQMYDVNTNNMVNKQELEVLLNHIPKDILSDNFTQTSPSIDHFDDNHEYVEGQYTNHDIAEKAFEECDLHHEGIYHNSY